MGSGTWPDGVELRNNQRVMVTGGAGFLGSFIVEKLQARGAAEVIVPRRADYDPSALLRACLRDSAAIRRLFATD